MAQKNRANMLTDIVSNIYNNLVNFITGQNAQDRFVNLLDSSPNILSDKDQADGYVGLGPTSQMFSSYYNENISRSDLITLLAANLAVGFKFYQVNDAVASTRILLVQADSNITLYPIGTDLATGEQGTYDITTDVFLPISGGNASITPITAAALLALQSTSAISTTTLYNVTNAVGSTLVLQVYAIASNTNVVYAIDVATGAIGTYNITTDTFTVATPDLQQVTTAGSTTSVGISVDNGTESIVIKHDLIKIVNALGAEAVITSPNLATTTNFEIPNKSGGTETFAMLSDIGVPYTGATADVDLGTHSLTADTIGIGVAAGAEKLHIDGGATTTRVKIDADNGVSRILSFRTDDVQRWALRVDGIESGANSGGNFQLRRYNDAGAHIDNPIAINRANGNITTAQNINGATPTELGYLSGLGSQAVGTTDTNTLTNKRITARTGTVASDATPTINTDNVDFFSITAQTVAITSFSTNLTGTPTEGQTLWIAITGTAARAITWGASFEASTIALPTTTVTTARLDVAFIWNSVTSKWRCVGTC